MMFRSLLCVLVGTAALAEVTPIEKVIQLLTDLKEEVETEAEDEAKAYDKFSCFCKDTTDDKVTSVNKQHDLIGENSADIADKTQIKADKTTELGNRKKKQEKLSADLESTNVRCAKEKAEYNAEAADLSNAISGLKDAISAMEGSKSASLISIGQKLSKTLAMAEVLNMKAASSQKSKVVMSLLQKATVDPSDPGYKFHSGEIIEVCNDVLKDYQGTKKDLDDAYGISSKACSQMKSSLKEQMGANQDAMDQLVKDISKLGEEIADHRTTLIEADAQLKDDEQYLNDLKARCEARANDWDQRSVMRNGEIKALSGALDVLINKASAADERANKRALFVQKSVAASTKSNTEVAKVLTVATLKSVSFLQEVSQTSSLRGGLSQEARKTSALTALKAEGQRLSSMTLMSFSARVAADPFAKVKGLIQKLIERLLTESKNEATKKGFCDTELAKSRKDRDFRWTEANDLSAALAKLEAKEDSLVEEIKQLTADLKADNEALKKATDDREAEKKINLETLKVAKDGLEAVNNAILILKTFYKQAAKAAFVQASPVDEDTAGAGFSGNYKGSQGKSKAVFALLDTIASDFDRTLRKTGEAEKNAHREFVAFSQDTQMSIGSKETKKELDEQDLETTRTSLKTKSGDMQTAVNLLDKALQELEELKPTCIDTGMSYSERVAKREEEIKALENALTILSPA
jgi:hypothetical protein